ncbi:MAG: hypothetical protein ACYCO5_09295 [Acidobacteriaceae bacterium]
MSRRRSWPLVAGGITLGAVLYRIFHGTRAIDWLILSVDGLVLSVIVLFEGPGWWHKRRAAKKVKILIPLLERGRQIQSSVPYQHRENSPELSEWAETAKSWWTSTEAVLAALSPRAATAFNHLLNFDSADRVAMDRSGRPYHLCGYAGDMYQSLQLKLGNLQRIIENPETYF